MNEKKAKALRKEMRKYFGDPLGPRVYQALNNQRLVGKDKDGKTVSFMGPGTIKATGMRRLYQDTKVTIRVEGLPCR